MDTITLSAPTVHCRSCQLNIEDAVEELSGIDAVSVDVTGKVVTVYFDSSITGVDDIVATIEAAGYPVER
jgi:copper chaperone